VSRSTSRTYGDGIEDRLTGAHETAPYNKFSYGVSNRGASVRIPAAVAAEKRGYLEDRRPNANIDPYVVAAIIVETICGAAKATAVKKAPSRRSRRKRHPRRRWPRGSSR
jgi:glutamine synthetase